MRLTRRQLVAGAPLLAACRGDDPRPGRKRPRDTGTVPSGGPPNVVLLFLDQWRADAVGAFGHPLLRTPAIDALAAESVAFRNHFTVGALCQPARVSLTTVQYPRQHGSVDNKSGIDPTMSSHVRRMRDEAGYLTAIVGKAHLTTNALQRDTADTLADLVTWGFEDVIEVPGDRVAYYVDNVYREWLRSLPVPAGEPSIESRYLDWWAEYEAHMFHDAEWETVPISAPPYGLSDDELPDTFVGDTAAAWIREAPPERPFYLQVNFPGPHPPWNASDLVDPYDPDDPRWILPYLGPIGGPVPPLVELARSSLVGPTTEAQVRKLLAIYAQRVTLVDRAIGAVMAALEEAGRLDDTWIVCTSDHGEMLGEKQLLGKVVLYRESTAVPLFVRPPGGVDPWTSDAFVELIDVGQTILELGGLEPEVGERGRSVLDLVLGGPTSPLAHVHRDDVVSQCSGFAGLRTADHLLVADESASEPVEYYDLRVDPGERDNRVDDPASASVREELLARLIERLS